MGITEEYIRIQVKSALYGLSDDDFRKVIFAYEPIWAIGTGRTPTPEEANEVCKAIRSCLREKYGARPSRATSILYGGSMTENIDKVGGAGTGAFAKEVIDIYIGKQV